MVGRKGRIGEASLPVPPTVLQPEGSALMQGWEGAPGVFSTPCPHSHPNNQGAVEFPSRGPAGALTPPFSCPAAWGLKGHGSHAGLGVQWPWAAGGTLSATFISFMEWWEPRMGVPLEDGGPRGPSSFPVSLLVASSSNAPAPSRDFILLKCRKRGPPPLCVSSSSFAGCPGHPSGSCAGSVPPWEKTG